MVINKRFKQDFVEVENRFPKLSHKWHANQKLWIISGELDICDTEGFYWNTFDIMIAVPHNYPFCIPIVLEISTLIPRDVNWHISEEGVCCIDVSHNLIVLSKDGINICDFIIEKIYPFFANQLYRLEVDKYAGEEYKHFFDGIIQYYLEEHKLADEETVLRILSHILEKKATPRNENCPCGSKKKAKFCHLRSINIIKKLGHERINSDIENIKSRLAP